MDLTLAKVNPLLPKPVPAGQAPRVEGWLKGIAVHLNNRYGDALTLAIEPLFLVYVADAVQRRLDKAKQMVDSEGAGPFNVRWNAASALGGWFLQPEVDEMDDVTGMGGTRTYRTPAPDHIRLNNRVSSYASEDLDVIANDAIGRDYVSSDEW